MKLYYAPGACSLAPHIVIREAGLTADLVRVKFGGPKKLTEAGEDYLSINPKGAVPALELDDGSVLTENAVLLQYLASLTTAAALAPQGGMGHWRFLETLNFIATELHKGFSPLFNPKITPEWRAGVIEKLQKAFDTLERMLRNQTYLAAGHFTVADAYAFTVLRWADKFKIDLSPWPNIIAFQERIAARPTVREALAEEGLLEPA